MPSVVLEEIKKLKAIAETGLLYCSNEYDRERYEELLAMSYRLLSNISGQDAASLKINLPAAADYPTVKVDVRGLLLSPENKILLVQEMADGKWALPGGWADIGYSPAEVIIKEFREEAGLQVVPQNLLAVFDKQKHAHPPQPFYIYKMFFYCRADSFITRKGFDVLDVQFFFIDALPPLSEERVLKEQVELLYKKVLSADFETLFD
ncbi:MAG: NUDIX hydrolase [Ferruginibacter sp.]